MSAEQTTEEKSLTTTKPALLLINGPNLNLLGTREPQKYGTTTLAQLEEMVSNRCLNSTPELTVHAFQSNHEGAILDFIHSFAPTTNPEANVRGVIINAAAYTHTSVAIRDALLGVTVPFVEVHITNVHAREEFRHRSYLSDKAEAVICGLGIHGYLAAVDWFADRVKKEDEARSGSSAQ